MNFDNKNKFSIRTLFNKIAPNYDIINELMSFGLQKHIKQSYVKNAVKMLGYQPEEVLDLCCGTGDISRIIKNLYPNSEVVGVDFSEEMLSIAKQKSNAITYLSCDITDIKSCPQLSDKKFDICFIAFGLRNLPDIDDFLNDIKTFLKPNGLLAILDLGKPNPILKPYFLLHYKVLIPIIAKIFSKDISPYKYFTNSAKTYPPQKEIIKKLVQNGYTKAKNKNYAFGIIATQTGKI